jgi:hypothetical protein
MKKSLTIAAGLIASAALMMVASPSMAAHVDVGVNIGIPGVFPAPVYVVPQPVYVQPPPIYVQPPPFYIQMEREREWHERHWQERHWQDRHEHRWHHDDHGGYHGHDD